MSEKENQERRAGDVSRRDAEAQGCGNAAAMREALERAKRILSGIATLSSDQESRKGAKWLLDEWVAPALAKPPRNCDVGTAEEQAERYGRYCDKFTRDGMHCETCPCCGKIQFGKCEFAWAQMPYEDPTQEGSAK